jgi:hypothetical protein
VGQKIILRTTGTTSDHRGAGFPSRLGREARRLVVVAGTVAASHPHDRLGRGEL